MPLINKTLETTKWGRAKEWKNDIGIDMDTVFIGTQLNKTRPPSVLQRG